MKALTVAQVAQELQVDRDTIYRLIRSGKLRAFKVGSDWWIDARDFEDFITRAKRETEAMVRRAGGYRATHNPGRLSSVNRGDVEYWKGKIDAIGKDKPEDWLEELERKAREGRL